MTTAASLINQALTDLGVENELSPSDPFLQEQSFNALIRMLNRWLSVGIDLGITLPTVPADDLGNPDDTEDAIATSLAIAVQKIAKRPASPALRKDQKTYYRQMKAVYVSTPVQDYPSSLPLGQGVNLGPRSRRFFPDPEATQMIISNKLRAMIAKLRARVVYLEGATVVTAIDHTVDNIVTGHQTIVCTAAVTITLDATPNDRDRTIVKVGQKNTKVIIDGNGKLIEADSTMTLRPLNTARQIGMDLEYSEELDRWFTT